jgi:hypothetical protein
MDCIFEIGINVMRNMIFATGMESAGQVNILERLSSETSFDFRRVK